MGKTYSSTITIRCWKEHTCVGCGGIYAYELNRKISGTGSTAAAAETNCRKAVQKAIDTATNLEACPTCGLYQPDMIGQRKASKVWGLFWIALIGFGVIVGLRAGNVLQADTATWTSAIAAAAMAFILLIIDSGNPNRDTESNRASAAQKVTAGQIRHAPGRPDIRVDEFARPAKPFMHLAGLGLLLASVAIIAAPELLRSVRGWPLNSECYPPVLGPGDSTRIYMPGSISSLKGYWRAKASAVIREAGNSASKEYTLAAKTNENTWGSTISVKSSEKYTSSHPWVEITLPDDPELAKKTVTCDVELKDLAYPEASGSGFVTRHSQMNRTLTLNLAPANAGTSYNNLWWLGTLGGMITALVCSLILRTQARAFENRANPTRTFT
jgi:hypothetical protein